MKTKKVTLLSMLFLLLVCIMPLSVSARDRECYTYKNIPKKITLLYSKNDSTWNNWYLDGCTNMINGVFTPGFHAFSPATYGDKMYTITNAKSTNNKVVKITAGLDTKYYKGYVRLALKGTGKAIVTFRENNHWDKDSKKYKDYKVEVTVKEVSNTPLKSLKIGKKDYTSKIKKGLAASGANVCSGKIDVKTNSGWKLVKIVDKISDANWIPVSKSRKNGYTLVKNERREGIEFIFQHTKTKVKMTYRLTY